jgi:AGCS family alanine or glycine:cation symporter
VPLREGFVALLEPFIDTVVICTMTALVVLLTGAYNSPEAAEFIAKNQGAALTSMAFASVVSWFPYVLSFAVVLFAFSTMISWSYYGERCWAYMFGERHSIYYKLLFLAAAFLGSVTSAINVLEFSDLMILAMAFPNLIGLYVLGPKVKRAIDEYKFP